jgi:putative hemolysin
MKMQQNTSSTPRRKWIGHAGGCHMHLERAAHIEKRGARLQITAAQTDDDIRAAQRLRWQVFADEQGAALNGEDAGYDVDALDAFCDHLVVKELATNRVVGTYRLLTAEGARRFGGYYSEQEFDIGVLASGRRLLEVGRSCVHRDYRNGATIALLWSGIAFYLNQSNYDAVIGCASIPLNGRPAAGMSLARRIASENRSSEDLRVISRCPLPEVEGELAAAASIPPLIKGYLRSGAVVCGDPYWDRDFNSADLLMYLSVDSIDARYARHFLAPATAAAWMIPECPSSNLLSHRNRL